jgi:predicted phage terminase large subunit-like protein
VLEDVVKVGGQRLIINLPPRHAKTETVLHFIAWVLAQRPEWTVGYASYAQTFSESKTLKAQRYAMAAGVQPDPKLANRQEWRTPEGGGILTTSTGGPLTGQGLNVLVIDDPVKDRAEADSPTFREKAWAWFEDVAETRLEPGASVVILMTRWHEDDLVGRVIANRPEYTVIRIPALADGLDALGKSAAPDPLGREVGEALWPERYGATELEKMRADKPYTFASLFQGLPRPREGRPFKEPAKYAVLPSVFRYGRGGDLAYTKSTRANHTAVCEMVRSGDLYYVTRVEKWQEEIGVTTTKLRGFQERKGGRIRLEANGPQKAIIDTLEANGVKVDRFQPVTDKLARAQDVMEDWNAGRVLVPDLEAYPEAREWLPAFLEELFSFTGVDDPRDDQVDALVNAHSQLRVNRTAAFSQGSPG